MAQQHNKKASNNQTSNQQKTTRKGTPQIVERVNKFPIVNFAVSMGFTQYGRLKSSNITVGDVMTRAENLAVYFWQKVQPIVEKLQEPINKADMFACQTLDFVEDKFGSVKIPQSPLIDSLLTTYNKVAAPVLKNIKTTATAAITNVAENNKQQQQEQVAAQH